MGGYYTLLAAGVDARVSFGVDELGAGHLADSDSALGQLELDPERKAIWLQAFDPYFYAARTKARIFMNLAANDYFFRPTIPTTPLAWSTTALCSRQAMRGRTRGWSSTWTGRARPAS